MPELPEVETVVRTLAPKLTGRRIVDAQFFSHHVVRQNFSKLRAHVRNQAVNSIRRHGKFIVLELDHGVLSIHLGMTGKLLLNTEPGPYARAIFELDQGLLVYDDIRHFGRIEWSAGLLERAAELGPDALDITLPDFLKLLKQRHARVKPLLMNQRFLRGMGNIYTDEALFEARIHPRAIASSLSKERATRLHTRHARDPDGGDSVQRIFDFRLCGCRRREGQLSVAAPGVRARGRALVLSAGPRSAGSWWASAERTIVRSASEAEHLVRHLRDRFHLGDIVDANDMRAAEDRGRDSGSSGAFEQRRGLLLGLRQK